MSSLCAGANQIHKAIRSHWGVENKVHWSLHVAFIEDGYRKKAGITASNLYLINRLALNLLKKRNPNISLKAKNCWLVGIRSVFLKFLIFNAPPLTTYLYKARKRIFAAKLHRMIRTHENENRIVVGITNGDMNGIGYEVIIKALLDPRIFELFAPVVYGSSKVASYHRKSLNINDFSFNLIKIASQANPKRPNIINVHDKDIKIDIGLSTPEAGELSMLALEAAVDDLKNKQIDVLVTAPINKKNIQSDTFHFTGHTEYLADKFGVNDFLMLMVSNQTRIGVVTGHIPLSEVPKVVTEDLILRKLKIMNESLKIDFNIRKPRIAVLGMNPHAGDEGLLGSEEKTLIIPAIEQAFAGGILAFGPFPADGFFGSDNYTKFDGILAMYHDQGLIPFKTISFGSGVNFTAGLPVVRTSPAHGTAYDIAGKDMASPDSLRAAMYLACDIFNNRLMQQELNANPLILSKFEAEK